VRLKKNGLLLGVEDVNAKGGINGHKLELVVEDNGGQAPSAVSGMQKMISSDQIDIAISAFTHIAQATKGAVAQANIPMFYIASLPDIAKENPLFFRDYFDAVNLGDVLGQHILKTNIKTVAYLGEQSDACFPYRDEVRRVLEADGRKVLIDEEFVGTTNDFRTQLLKIKSAKVGGIVTCAWKKSDLLMTQLKELGMISLPTFQTVAPFLPNADTKEIRALYEENGTVSTWYGLSFDSLNESQKAFANRYEQKFGKKLSSDAAFAYDDVMVISQALNSCFGADGKIDNKCFAEQMLKTNYSGISGKLSFDSNRLSQRDGILIKVVNGEWVKVR